MQKDMYVDLDQLSDLEDGNNDMWDPDEHRTY